MRLKSLDAALDRGSAKEVCTLQIWCGKVPRVGQLHRGLAYVWLMFWASALAFGRLGMMWRIFGATIQKDLRLGVLEGGTLKVRATLGDHIAGGSDSN